MLKKSRLLAGAVAAAAAVLSSGVMAAEVKGAVYGDLRYGLTHIDDDVGVDADQFMGDNGSFWGIKASTTSGSVTAFGGYERVIDTDDCVGASGTTLCAGNSDIVRQAFGGVKGMFGTVQFGTHETAYSQMARRFDPFFETGVSDWETIGAIGFGPSYGGSILSQPLFNLAYVNNHLAYTTPDFSGLSANAAYFSNEATGETDDPDYGLGVDFNQAGIKAGVQHLRIRSTGAGTPNFIFVPETDATVISVGYAADAFGVGIMHERLDLKDTPGAIDPHTTQLSGWFGVMPGTRIAAAVGSNNEYFNEGTSVTAGVFHDVVDNFTVHVAASMLEGDADNGTPDAQTITIGANYRFNLGFSGTATAR